MSYGPDFEDIYRAPAVTRGACSRAAARRNGDRAAARVQAGAEPEDAREIGLAIPQAVRLRADEVSSEAPPLAAWLAAALAAARRHGACPCTDGCKVPRIGVLRSVCRGRSQAGLTGALAAIGYHDGRTIQIEWRWATRAMSHSATPPNSPAWGWTCSSPLPRRLRWPCAMSTHRCDHHGHGGRPGGRGTGRVPCRPGATSPACRPICRDGAKQLQLLLEVVPGLQRVAFSARPRQGDAPLRRAGGIRSTRAGHQAAAGADWSASEFDRAVDAWCASVPGVVVQPLFTLDTQRHWPGAGAAQVAFDVGLAQFALAGGS